jgi:hypothetical protein
MPRALPYRNELDAAHARIAALEAAAVSCPACAARTRRHAAAIRIAMRIGVGVAMLVFTAVIAFAGVVAYAMATFDMSGFGR